VCSRRRAICCDRIESLPAFATKSRIRTRQRRNSYEAIQDGAAVMVTDNALRLVPLFRILTSSLRNDRWQEFKRVFREGLSAIAVQTRRRAGSVLSLPVLASVGSVREPPRLFQLASGYWISQALYVAAKLRIADLLKNSPKSASEIAFATETDEDSVYRLMRALCAVGAFRTVGVDKFAVTALGIPLQSNVPGSLRAMVITLGESHYAAWAHLLESVKTGKAGFPLAFGTQMFDYLGQDAEAGNIFNHAMSEYSALSACAVLLSYDFSDAYSLVDVGGGCGRLLTNILRMYPSMQGTLFDMPSVVAAAQEKLEFDPCSERCALVPGSFLDFVPPGADTYLMSSVIHDWDDEHAIKILRNCRRSMRRHSRIILLEFIVPAGKKSSFSKVLDLNMLVMNGGRERTAEEFRKLFDAAGLKMTRIIPTLSPLSVIEAVRYQPSDGSVCP
jgi:ubiquinone/menaquinone biosynthesis C-methylase UbiE